MNIADPFKQLVERKLWPIALLLVAALVAVPFLLAKDPEAPVLPTAVAAGAGGDDVGQSVVTLDDATRIDEARAVLGARKDPFRPAQLHPIPTVEDSLGESAAGSQDDSSSSDGGPGAGAPGGDDTPAAPVDSSPTVTPTQPQPTATPAQPDPTYDLYSLKVRFGQVDGELATREVKRLTGLPGGTNPAVLYLGLSENRRSAVFLVDAAAEVIGDGECDPSPDNCQTLVLEPGETAFLARGENEWQLDLIDITVSKTTDAAAARASRQAVAEGGRRALKRFKGTGGYRYSKATGTVRRIARPVRGLTSRQRGAGGSRLVSGG